MRIARWVAIAVVIYVLMTQTDRAFDAIGNVLGKLGDFVLRALESISETISLDVVTQIVRVAFGG